MSPKSARTEQTEILLNDLRTWAWKVDIQLKGETTVYKQSEIKLTHPATHLLNWSETPRDVWVFVSLLIGKACVPGMQTYLDSHVL